MYHIFCIHSYVEGYLGSFLLLAIINKAAMSIVKHVFFLPVGTSSGYMPRRGIAGSSGSTMSNFLRNRQTDFQSGCTSLQSHQQWRSVPLFPHPCQHLLSPEILILTILTGVTWNLRVVLICISLMTLNTSFLVGESNNLLLWIQQNCLLSENWYHVQSCNILFHKIMIQIVHFVGII